MYKRLPRLVATALIATLGGWIAAMPAAQAWDVSYDFTANGKIYEFTGSGAAVVEGDSETVIGTVTFKILRVAPPPDIGAGTDGSTIASYNGDGWIETEWQGTTSKGNIEPEPLPTGVLVHNVSVHNLWDGYYSSQDTVKYYYDTSGNVDFGTRFTGISRQMYSSPPWFSGLNFDTGRSPEYNFFWVADYARDTSGNHTGFSGSFLVDDWTLASLDLLPLADKLAALPGGRGLSVLISTVQAQYDAGDMAGACQMLTAFSSQARGLAHNQNFAEMAGDALLDAELIGKILECN